MEPIKDMLIEHGHISKMLKVLQNICGKIERDGNVPREALENGITFIKEFADRCHHGKEEDLLFPAMRENNIPEESALINELLEEHGIGRRLVKNMSVALEENNLNFFCQNAKEYASLITSHIVKENQKLFLMARKSLPSEKMASLGKAFEDFEKEKIGTERHQELLDILSSLSQKF